MCVSDQSSLGGGRHSEELAFTVSPKTRINRGVNQKIVKKSSKGGGVIANERNTSIENHMTFRRSQNISYIHSPKPTSQPYHKYTSKNIEEEKRKRPRKAKSRKDDKKCLQKLNHSMNNPSFYQQFTQETYMGEL